MSEPLFRPGHSACQGCGEALGMRLVLEALGPRCVVVVVPSCLAIIAGPFPHTSLGVPAFHSAFEVAAPSAAGISAALKALGQGDRTVVALAGDGGTFDIGLQSLSGAADRNEDLLYVCFDNEAYMNTGIQVSSATPRYAWTGTTPAGNPRRKKNIIQILAAHRVPYAATACVGFPQDLQAKVKKAQALRGLRFLHLLSPCTTGWRIGEDQAPLAARLAVETNVFPLYEIEDGLVYTLTHQPLGLPVDNYLSLQGRFKHLDADQTAALQAEADRAWAELKARAGQA